MTKLCVSCSGLIKIFSLFPGCYPFYGDDPFVIDKCPHVYFAGNSHSFQHTKVQGTALCTPQAIAIHMYLGIVTKMA